MQQLYDLLFKPFERSNGVIIYGPVTLFGQPMSQCSWGRRVQLPTNEFMQIMFTPRRCFAEPHEGIVMMSVRLTNPFAQSFVRTLIVYPPEQHIPQHCDPLRDACAHMGPSGLHLLMASFFKLHNPFVGLHRPSGASKTTDPSGYVSVRSTTFSIVPLDLKRIKSGAKIDHTSAVAVAPGTSGMVIAGEIVNAGMPDASRRASEPISKREYDAIVERAIEGVCRDDAEVGRSALASAMAISELLSGEGLLAMQSNPFFKGALPDALLTPQGLPMILSMAVRMAMSPGRNGLRAGCISDQVANSELRTLFEAQIESLPLIDGHWALDIAINMAWKTCQGVKSGTGKTDMPMYFNDQKVFWQRLGQRVISSTFGLGTSLDKYPASRFGTPWRFIDPIIAARDEHHMTAGVRVPANCHNSRICLAAITKRRETLVKMLLETERYLRTGVFRGVRLHPTNDEACTDETMITNQATLNEIIMPQIRKRIAATGKVDIPSQKKIADQLYGVYNMKAMSAATIDITEAMTAGPSAHFKHAIGAFLVAESQVSPCCDCGESVHVLQGIMLNFGYGECINCHAKRCLRCSGEFGMQIMAGQLSEATSKVCTRCGKSVMSREPDLEDGPNLGQDADIVSIEMPHERSVESSSTESPGPSPRAGENNKRKNRSRK